MFSRVLVANRGEIAVRVQQTLRALGVETAAVYSEPDALAPHVRIADYAFSLDGHTAEETYLNVGKLLAAARHSKAQAVHPGYGFLSENPAFARACLEAGLAFIGPSPECMEALGDKVYAKEIARQAGVPVVPNSPVLDGVGPESRSFLTRWGFPVLVKAAAGGGGRGMRVVNSGDALAPALDSARREAQAAFGDGRVFLERYIPHPRHVEVQVLADGSGHTVHLLERECSVQRRHQKVIEESPSPALTTDQRQRMGEAAVALARAAGYVNAGTAEFLLDGESKEFYFLEMNTRLQVEHPVTEAILGLDLVAWQARIAAGEPMTMRQEDIRPQGHAIECRIYAEDPYQGFAPSTGTLARWRPPSGPGLRLDSGVVEGQEVSVYYDSMLAKLIAWGPDRVSSLQRMEQALGQFPVLGVSTNIPLLREILRYPPFQSGGYDTRLLEGNPDLLAPPREGEQQKLARALAAWWSGAPLNPPLARGDNRAARGDSDANPWQSGGNLRLP